MKQAVTFETDTTQSECAASLRRFYQLQRMKNSRRRSDRRGEDRLAYTKQRRVRHRRASQSLERILEANRDTVMLE